MKQTVIHQLHVQRQAAMTEFRGWQVPSRYADAGEEYRAVRMAAGLFDIGYLGRIELSGPGAANLLQQAFTRNVEKIPESSTAFGLLCTESGTILTDAVLFRLPAPVKGAAQRFLLTVSAENADKIAALLTQHAVADVAVTDRTASTAQFALQGPASSSVLEKLSRPHFKKIRPRHIKEFPLGGSGIVTVARTGYTGEDGYEFLVSAEQAETLWNLLLEAGRDAKVIPCGLESRDVLRLEMGYPLYGNDIDETRTPLEAGLATLVDFRKDFTGKDALLKMKAAGVEQRIVGFILSDKAAPRPGGSIFSENREIGTVTSGAISPALRGGIGLGYVFTRYAQAGQEVDVEAKDREIAAQIEDLPLYRKK